MPQPCVTPEQAEQLVADLDAGLPESLTGRERIAALDRAVFAHYAPAHPPVLVKVQVELRGRRLPRPGGLVYHDLYSMSGYYR